VQAKQMQSEKFSETRYRRQTYPESNLYKLGHN